MKQLVKRLVALTPYRVLRKNSVNRFDGMEDVLKNLQRRGFAPNIVIDGGANVGKFSLMTSGLFPESQYHLIEPQESCHPVLEPIAKSRGWQVHPYALGSGEVGSLAISRTDRPSTGAYIHESASDVTTMVNAATLDSLFGGKIYSSNRVLLKLDLQGYELHALRGAAEILPQVEVIISEVSFFSQTYEPSILDLIQFLGGFGFVLYDVASISGRSRDNRARQGDFVFLSLNSALFQDTNWS